MKYFPGAPQPGYLRKRFGSVFEAYQAVFTTTIESTKEKVVQILGGIVGQVESYEDFFILDDFITIKIIPSVPIPQGYGYEWFFRVDTREIVDITLGVALSDVKKPEILGYFPLPRLMMTENEFRFNDQSSIKIEMFGFRDLEFFRDIV